MSEEEGASIFAHFDNDGSGSIQFAEFEEELNADLKVGAAGEILVESRNQIELRSVEDAEMVSRVLSEKERDEKYAIQEIFKLCVLLKVSVSVSVRGEW